MSFRLPAVVRVLLAALSAFVVFQPPQLSAAGQTQAAVMMGDRRVIPFKVSAMMWDSTLRKTVPTPAPMIEKIKAVFRLWGSVDEAKLFFRDDGLETARYRAPADIPDDGAIHIVLDGPPQSDDPGAAGYGGY